MADRNFVYVGFLLAGFHGHSQFGTQGALGLSVMVLAISAMLYQMYLFRKGDVE